MNNVGYGVQSARKAEIIWDTTCEQSERGVL